MKTIFFVLLISIRIGLTAQSCSALFSYGAQFEKVCFSNVSTVSNAHYYWNFGDGTSSFLKNPCHDFDENGIYNVTLYVLDTLSKCSNYYSQWITITKYSTEPCSPFISDSVYTDLNNGKKYFKLVDYSTGCSGYSKWYSYAGGTANEINLLTGFPHSLVASASYGNPQYKRRAYKTCVNAFDYSKNYTDCSANYEFSVISEDAVGQTIFFKAMNPGAASYQWFITGFGSPIIINTDTMSYHFPGYDWNWTIYLFTKGQSGCRDSTLQQIKLRNKSVTYVDIKESQNKKELDGIIVFPNPVKDKFRIQLDNGNQRSVSIELFNCMGELILSKQTAEMEIDLSNFSSAVYFLKIRDKNAQKVVKLVKE